MGREEKFNAAVLAMQQGDHPRAQLLLRRLLQKYPRNGYLWGTLGLSLVGAGDIHSARPAYEKAVQFDPHTTIWKEQLGHLLLQFMEVEAALEVVQDLPTPGGELVRAFAHEVTGDFASALQCLEAADQQIARTRFAQDGRSIPPETWVLKAEILRVRCYRRLGRHQDCVTLAQETLRRPDAASVSDLYFEQGFAYHSLGEYRKAWESFERGNQFGGRSYDLGTFRAEREAELRAPRTHSADTSLGSGCIFIVGVPRSGTSLVEQILAQHDQVTPLGERLYIPQIAHALHGQGWPDLTPDDLRLLGESYLRTQPEGDRFTDKLPDNWRHVGLIRQILPGAKIVHCVRNREDTLLSCFQQNFVANGMAWACSVEGLEGYWEEWAKTEVGGHTLRYEDLVRDTERTVRELLEYLGLPFQEACLHPEKASRLVATASYDQVKRPVNDSSVGKALPYREWLPTLPGVG